MTFLTTTPAMSMTCRGEQNRLPGRHLTLTVAERTIATRNTSNSLGESKLSSSNGAARTVLIPAF